MTARTRSLARWRASVLRAIERALRFRGESCPPRRRGDPRALSLLLCALFSPLPLLAAPALPFSGLYGGTAGAGSALGWDRFAAGSNPAALGRPGTRVSLAGYSPFGLAGMRTLEAGVARDGARRGVSAVYQNWIDDGRLLSAEAEAQTAVRIASASLGFSLAGRGGETRAAGGFAAGAGGLWRPGIPGRFLGIGAQARFDSREPLESLTAAFGADLSFGLPGPGLDGAGGNGPGVRLCGEALRIEEDWEARFGAALHLHASLAIHAGWIPRRRTAALGVRFGAGAWEGFSAVRRHATLGGTAVQGLRWRPFGARAAGAAKEPGEEEEEDAKGEGP